MIGSQLAHFRITAKLGEGGMGEVYRAEDTTLSREVAIKVLPETFGADRERLARFEREARLLASVNHPNIATLYSLEVCEGRRLLVMELVAGETLARRILRGPLPPEEAMPLFRQVAEALGAAHRKGVIHRDLKPSNIQITPDGRVKLLDFGLAKAIVSRQLGDDADTLVFDQAATKLGVLVGTVPYMSPEQARGREVDSRTDVWSFGCCLFESLTGIPLFRGETASDTLAWILAREPGWDRLPTSTPDHLIGLLRRCLCKDREARLASIDGALEGLDPQRSSAASISQVSPSVAALPFVTFGINAEAEVFADGITEDVIAQLAKIDGLKVIARGSVMGFKQREQSLREIGELLGVATLLDGSVRRVKDRVRIVVQLIEAASERPLWSETYDRHLVDIFAIQSDVALRIASALSAELSSDVQQRIEKRPTDNLEAYRLYLEGRHCLLRMTTEGIHQGLELYGRAIGLDPAYASAHAGRSLAYVLIGMSLAASVLSPREAYAKAEEAVVAALRLDPDLGEAHATLGFIRLVSTYDWKAAEEDMQRALELSPGSTFTLGFLAHVYSAQGRHEAAIDALRRARDLDPLNPVYFSDIATKHLRAGLFEEAIEEARRLLALEPGYPLGHSTLGWAYVRTGRTEEGLAELEMAVEIARENTMLLAQLGQAYAEVGQTEDARFILEKLSAMALEQYVSPYHLAYVYTGLGEHDRAVDCLNRAFDEHASGLYGVKGSFLFTSLHDHPGFRELLRRMHLA